MLRNIPPYRAYWIYSLVTAIVWAVLLTLLHTLGGQPAQPLLLIFLGFCLCWGATTIARYAFPPPKRWTAQRQPEKLSPYRAYWNYWLFSLGLAVIWAVTFALAQTSGSGALAQSIQSVFLGFAIFWVSATIARYYYAPPQRWTANPPQNTPAPPPVGSQTGTSPSGLGGGAMSPLTLGLISCGGVGALLFTVTYLVEGLTRPGYDASQQPISALSLGSGGWAQQVNFVVFGILLALSAVGWRRLLTPGRASIGFPLVQGLLGLCMMVVGFFSQDPGPGYPPGVVPGAPTVHEMIHTVAAYTIFIALACGCFVLARRFAVEPGWRGWATYSTITGIVIVVFFALFPTTYGSGSPAGLFERVSALAHAVWTCLLVAALWLRRQRVSG